MRNRRIALGDEDCKLIIVALWNLHEASIINPEVFPKYALASKQRINEIERKLAQADSQTKEGE